MKILIIAATHGNELLGTKLLAHIFKHHGDLMEYIDFIVGNPRALAKKKRYIESDLNRSYGVTSPKTYEQKRAKWIQEHVQTGDYDIVLDMHTTTVSQPNILIIGDTSNAQVKQYLRACHIDKVLHVTAMNDIASVVDNLVAYEIPNKSLTTKLLDDVAKDICRFINHEQASTTKQLYTMQEKIYKKDYPEKEIDGMVNFEESKFGFVPIMVGNNSYKKQTDYRGFKSAPPVGFDIT